MERRSFLKLIGAVVLAPSLPIPTKTLPVSPWFIYKGYEFRKDIVLKPFGECIQLYTEVEIYGERYCKAVLIDEGDYKYRDMYLDNMIHGINRMRQKKTPQSPQEA